MLLRNESTLSIEHWEIRLQFEGSEIKKVIKSAYSWIVQKEVKTS